MREDAFNGGMKVIEAALQGECMPQFIALVRSNFQEVDDDRWMRMVELLCRSTKRARDLNLNDFLHACTDVSATVHASLKHEQYVEARKSRSEAPEARPLVEIFREMAEKHPTQWLKEVALELEIYHKGVEGEPSDKEAKALLLGMRYPERREEAERRMSAPPLPSPPGPPLPDPEPDKDSWRW